jgi:hypothetical protein
MRKNISRLFIFVLTFLLAWSVTIKPAQASIWDWIKAQFQSQEASENMKTSLTQEGVSGEKHVTETTSNLMNVINLHVLGSPTDEDTSTTNGMLRESVGPGLISVVNSGIVAMYDPPASSTTYVADLLQNAKIIPQAQAQGLGFASLDPILDAWKNFRNVAYLFFVVIFLVIGFMIMFRAKIGQAAITVQQAIPSIIVALLAVTFSYAIAGLLIDLMYVVMYGLITLFGNESHDLISGNIFTLVGAMFDKFGSTVMDAMENLMQGLLGQGVVTAALSWLSSLSAIMIIGLAILISVFKIFLELLKSYISIILQVVFAPIILMVGAIPGKNTFMSWVKNLTGNLLIWPLTLICLLVNRMLTSSGYSFNDSNVGGFMPPYLLGSGQGAAFPALVGIGILLVIPEIMKEAKKKLGVEEGIMGSLAGAALKQIQGATPIGSKAIGTVGGSAGGALWGIGKGVLETRNQDLSLGDRLGRIGSQALHYTGEGMSKGSKVGGAVSQALGGKSTGVIQHVEKGVDKATNFFGEEEKLKRITEGSKREKNWNEKRQNAEAQKRKREYEEARLREGHYGQEVTIKDEQT